jgi:xanthine dehydrogenase accessory factor
MTGELTRLAHELEERGEAHALATVVRVDRPVSAKAGDRALITEDGRLKGWVGGSCSEPVVVREALASLSEGAPRLVKIRPVGAPREPAQPGVVTEVTTCASEGGLDVFVEPRLPRPLLVVAGSSPTARTLVQLAKVLGYRLSAALDDPAERLPGVEGAIGLDALAAAELRPDDAVVVATMNRYDESALRAALETGAGYIGLVASKSRGAHTFELLRVAGVSDEQLNRVATPAGIDLGPSTQEEIALAILAEVVGQRHRVRSDQREPICAPEETAGGATDVVCGMKVAILPSTVSVRSGGLIYYFCTEHCRDQFLNRPELFGQPSPGAEEGIRPTG